MKLVKVFLNDLQCPVWICLAICRTICMWYLNLKLNKDLLFLMSNYPCWWLCVYRRGHIHILTFDDGFCEQANNMKYTQQRQLYHKNKTRISQSNIVDRIPANNEFKDISPLKTTILITDLTALDLHLYLNIGQSPSTFLFPSCGSVSAKLKKKQILKLKVC